MYNTLTKKCYGILNAHGIPLPKIILRTTPHIFSHTDGSNNVFLGLGIRIAYMLGLINESRLCRTILHEIMHVVVWAFPPSPGVRNLFGTPAEWDAPQRFLRVFNGPGDRYVSRYAQTHPEEDLVETSVSFLMEGRRNDSKSGGIEEWFAKITRE